MSRGDAALIISNLLRRSMGSTFVVSAVVRFCEGRLVGYFNVCLIPNDLKQNDHTAALLPSLLEVRAP